MNPSSSISYKFLLPGLIALVIGAIFLGWTFYSRKQADREFEKGVERREGEAARRFRAAYGSDDVRISGFSAKPSQIRRGDETLFCYGVLNAKVVRLDPPIDKVHPALSYCFNASPAKTTTFTLTAEDKDGKAVKQSVTVTVK